VIGLFLQTLILAQVPAEGAPANQPPNMFGMVVPMLVIFALFYFMMIRPQKRQQKELRDMVHTVKENDRVVTIGGIYGVVTNVQRDAERVTIRVDEATGTKIKVGMSAISRVLSAEDTDNGPATNKS
jgi:preprotein translocase subunit YajC